MNELMIHDKFLERLQEGNFRGTVHSVFQKAINIMDEEGILYTILKKEMDKGPMALHVLEDDLSCLNINVKDPVTGDEHQLILGKVSISLKEMIPYGFLQREYRPSPFLASNIKKVRLQLEEMKDENPSPYGREVERLLNERLSHLKNAFMRDDEANILEASLKLIGLGPGLTPSGDDMILGILSVLNLKNTPHEKYRYLYEQVIEHAYTQTNILSYFGLKRAYDGWIRQDITDFTIAMIEKENIEKELEKILQIGSSSGQDIAYGILSLLEASDIERKGV